MTYARVIIIGAGGTASWLAPPLAALVKSKTPSYHPPEIIVIDGDRVEERNLTRQHFDPHAVWAFKADALVTAMSNIYPEQRLTAIREFITEENVTRALRNNDLVILCVDNHACRWRVLEAASTFDNITVINTGNERFDGSIDVYRRVAGIELTPDPRKTHPSIVPDAERDPLVMSCAQLAAMGDTQTVTANFWSAAMALATVAKILDEKPTDPTVYWDSQTIRAMP